MLKFFHRCAISTEKGFQQSHFNNKFGIYNLYILYNSLIYINELFINLAQGIV